MAIPLTISRRTNTFLSGTPVLQATVLAVVSSLLIQRLSNVDGLNVGAIYSGTFGVLAIFAGFLATFFVFIATRSNKFLDAIRQTITFRQMLGLLKFTIQWTIFAVLVTLGFMVAEPRGYDLFSATSGAVFTWSLMITLICVNFSRCVSMFFKIVDQAD